MATMYKAAAVAAELADILAKRFSSLVVTQSTNNNYPTVLIAPSASPTAGQETMFFRVNQLTWANATNSIGNSQDVYDKVVLQLVTESNPTGGAGADILGPADLLPLLGELVRKGCRIEWYQVANGTVPSAAGITGTPASTFDPELYFPLVGW